MILAKLRYITGYKNMSRQQLESELAAPKPAPRPKKSTPTAAPRQTRRPKNITPTPASRPENYLSIPNDYKLEKIAKAFGDKYIEYESGNNEILTIKKYLENIRPGKWKIHLTMKMNFVSTTGSIEYRQMHSKSDKSEIISSFDTYEIP